MPTTLVTGAGGTIGTVICEHLAGLGHSVIGIARRPIANFSGIFHSADLKDEAETAAVLAAIMAEHAIDNLVNNAAMAARGSIDDMSRDAARAMYELNVNATIQVTQTVVKGMRAAGRGRVVNMCSRAMRGRERTSLYASSKAAVEGLTRSWAIELAGEGVTVNCVAPGFINSEMFARNNPIGARETIRDMGRVPMGRPGEPIEVATAVAYFLSEHAGYTTGQTLFVCGGWSI